MAATKQPLLSFLAVFSVIGYVSAQTDLYFSFMLSQSSDGVTSNVEQDTSGAASAVAVALDAINNESSILEGYRLIHSDVLNSQVCADPLYFCIYIYIYRCYCIYVCI